MYTTPRKVKQESRLRRTLSLTNASRLNGQGGQSQNGGNASTVNGDDYSSGEYHRHLHDIEESRDTQINTYFQFNGDLNHDQRSRYSYSDRDQVPDLVGCSSTLDTDHSIVVHPHHQQHHQYSHNSSNSGHKPPPYRGPPPGEIIFGAPSEDSLIVVTSSDPHHQGVPDSPISLELDSLQLHSSKFPIVQEVVISQPQNPTQNQQDLSNGLNYQYQNHQNQQNHQNPQNHQNQNQSQPGPNRIPIPVLSPEYIKKFQNKKLTKKKQIAWTDERKVFTLDSQTAKDLQERLATYPITRASSADLGKAIQDFNDEQSFLMSSMQQQGVRHLDGIDNPALDLGPHNSGSNGHHHNQHSVVNPVYPGGNKMSGGYNYSETTSQSLSLSSSNTDSLDTVIYKGPSQSTTSIRDWQRSMESNANGDFGHGLRHEGNLNYRDSSAMLDGHGRSSYQMQQPSYQHQPQHQQMQYTNGPGTTPATSNSNGNSGSGTNGLHGSNYAIEYRHSQQQHQVQQNLSNLSVHSIPSSSAGSSGGIPQSNSNRNGSGSQHQQQQQAYGSNPQLAAKSPMLSHKQFSTATASSNGQERDRDTRVTFSSNTTTEPMLVDKSKESTKLFPTKTYNHIKDMISSRFGHGSGASGKGLNNSVNSGNSAPNNSATSTQNPNPGAVGSGGQSGHSNPQIAQNSQPNSYIDLTMGVPSAYPNSHQHTPHMNGHVQNSYNSRGQGQPQQGNNSVYYPQNPNPNNMPMVNGNVPNSYRSPNMNDRKNVNTSFRKAIQHSTQKSNLAEESLQLRPILESGSQPAYNSSRVPQQFANPPHKPQHHDHLQETGVQERAQRALDKLMEAGMPVDRPNGPNPNPNNPSVYNRIQQFSNSNGQQYINEGHPVQPNPRPSQIPQSSGFNAHHAKMQFLSNSNPSNIKPGPGSSNSNSSSGLAMVESSLSSPGSYNGAIANSNQRIHPGSHIHPNDEIHNQQNQGQWGHLHHQQQPISMNSISNHDQAPPLPTSKKPESSEGSINTIGLPLPLSLSSVPSVEMRENGDGSSATMDTNTGNMLLESSTCSKVKSDQLKQITTDLQNIALSVAAEQHLHNNNHSSSSECEKGPQRVGSGQSHTTTDSGLGTVMLTKSPMNSNSDPSEHSGQMERPNADSVSSGNDSEWVDLVEPEIRQILEIERIKSGKPSLRTPPGNTGLALPSVTTSTPAATKTFHNSQQGGSSNNNLNSNPGNNGTNPNPGLGGKVPGGSALMADITASPILHTTKATLSPNQNSGQSPKLPKKFDLNNYNKKSMRTQSQELLAVPSTSQGISGVVGGVGVGVPNKIKSPRAPAKVQRSNSGSGQRWANRQQRVIDKNPKAGGSRQKDLTQTLKGAKLTRNAMNKLGQILYSLQDETGDLTSTTGLDFESALEGHTEFTTDDDDLSTTIDTTDAHAIRRQLESLETMYTEVLKVLGDKKFSRSRYPPNTAELRAAKRRPYGSMSSLPSSVSSRPFRERSRKVDDKKKVKDLKSINRRFQRLESHVVTLARSVAHLSSEMRTQHLMVQEMESIRNELQQLRNQVVKNTMQSQAATQNFNRAASGRHGAIPCANQTDWTSFRNALPSLTNPCRVRKLTKFFGDEPPLIRIFLKKLGYEKYAPAFEQERIGIMELPYLTEERLNKMGIPMGPRLRILQEAQLCLKPGYHGQPDAHHSHHPNNHTAGNLSVYVV